MDENLRNLIDGELHEQMLDNCIICWGKITDKALVNNCLHHFCYPCIVQWVQVRAVCPLCVQPITSIINNIRSRNDYDEHPVAPPLTDVLSNYDDFDIWALRDYDSNSELSSEETSPLEVASESEPGDDISLNFSEESDDDWYENSDLFIPSDDDSDTQMDDELEQYSSSPSTNYDYNCDGLSISPVNYSSNESETNDQPDYTDCYNILSLGSDSADSPENSYSEELEVDDSDQSIINEDYIDEEYSDPDYLYDDEFDYD